LGKESVDYVINMIHEDIHPISDTSLKKAFPLLCCCWCFDWPKSRGAHSQSNESGAESAEGALLNKAPKKKGKGSKKVGDNDAVNQSPILMYGFGISIYLKMMVNLSVMFTIFTLLCIPVFNIYSAGTAYEFAVEPPLYEQYSIGALGYSTQKCITQPLDIGKLTLNCHYGVIGKVLDYGYNDFAQTGRSDICMSNDITKNCAPNNVATLSELEGFLGKPTATWSFSIDKFFVDSIVPDTCSYSETSSEAYIFVSYECHHLPETQEKRYNQVVMIAIIGVLIAFLFLLWIRWSFQGSKIDLL
jgi:hypothetical protein